MAPLSEDWGPYRLAKYCTPLFWVACFVRADEVTVDRPRATDTYSDSPFMGLWAETRAARARLLSRCDGLMALMPAPLRTVYRELCDGFAAHLAAHYPHGVFLDGEDVFSMIGQEEAAVALRCALDALERIDAQGIAPPPHALERLSIAPVFAWRRSFRDAECAAYDWLANLVGSPAEDEGPYAPTPTDGEIAFANTLPRID